MKILKLGRIPEHRIFALEHRCPDCATVYRLEHGDHYWLQEVDGRHWVKTCCPVCGDTVSTPVVALMKLGETERDDAGKTSLGTA
jgi:predicted RNA-binding Zn-ribbon protein involved in translation (DUF1610 family)